MILLHWVPKLPERSSKAPAIRSELVVDTDADGLDGQIRRAVEDVDAAAGGENWAGGPDRGELGEQVFDLAGPVFGPRRFETGADRPAGCGARCRRSLDRGRRVRIRLELADFGKGHAPGEIDDARSRRDAGAGERWRTNRFSRNS